MPERRYRISFEVDQRLMDTIFDLVKDEATNFRMMELTDQHPVEHVNGTKKRWPGEDRWAEKAWPYIAPVFRSLNGGLIEYNDARLGDALERHHMARGTASPLLSALTRLGKVRRVKRGTYQLV